MTFLKFISNDIQSSGLDAFLSVLAPSPVDVRRLVLFDHASYPSNKTHWHWHSDLEFAGHLDMWLPVGISRSRSMATRDTSRGPWGEDLCEALLSSSQTPWHKRWEPLGLATWPGTEVLPAERRGGDLYSIEFFICPQRTQASSPNLPYSQGITSLTCCTREFPLEGPMCRIFCEDPVSYGHEGGPACSDRRERQAAGMQEGCAVFSSSDGHLYRLLDLNCWSKCQRP